MDATLVLLPSLAALAPALLQRELEEPVGLTFGRKKVVGIQYENIKYKSETINEEKLNFALPAGPSIEDWHVLVATFKQRVRIAPKTEKKGWWPSDNSKNTMMEVRFFVVPWARHEANLIFVQTSYGGNASPYYWQVTLFENITDYDPDFEKEGFVKNKTNNWKADDASWTLHVASRKITTKDTPSIDKQNENDLNSMTKAYFNSGAVRHMREALMRAPSNDPETMALLTRVGLIRVLRLTYDSPKRERP